ncbi:MAG: hypothetical protein OEV00_07675 [Acidobacteriota bacterium]|nr:hypothetical protein [Acidobacteriota bacterium]MDH3785193.1 hypothetical protein [Acidobacteriota bacterium]
MNRILWLLFAVCVVVLGADFFYHKHGHFSFENIFGFHALFGFTTFFGLVLVGKQLRKLLMRDEDYYDR